MKQCKLNLFPECPGYCPSGADFSQDKQYRYHLWRAWGTDHHKSIMFIGLNPSTANEKTDDPTIRRLVSFAKGWGFNSIHMYNLFALVSAYTEALFTNPKPISENQGTEGEMCMNDRNIIFGFETNNPIVFCWGSWKIPNLKDRVNTITAELKTDYWKHKNVMCFGKNKDGQPKHPLYLKSDTSLVPFF